MPFLEHIPTYQDIEKAHERIAPLIKRTPILTSSSLNNISGSRLFFKCENFQKTGSFKIRGAVNSVYSLTQEELAKGVATHSSGNHAAALTFAAASKGAKAYIVMPKTAPKVKIEAVKSYGAEIFFSEATLTSRQEKLEEVIEKTGATFVHPYDNYSVIAGQATAAKELIEEIPDLDFILVPVGGGGLASGTVLSANYFSEKVRIIGVEPANADDAYRSLRDGKIYPSINPQTVADGLLTSLSKKTFEILSRHIEKVITVQESSIISALKLLWQRLKIVVEPSAAVTLAAVLENKNLFSNKKVGLILSGGNVDLEKLTTILSFSQKA